jgi:tRNA pseudouridine13 synthase
LEDVVIPMVGTQVKYPLNESTDFINALIKHDNIELTDFFQNKVAFQAKGHYRNIVEKPKNVQYDIITHDDYEQDLQSEYYNVSGHPKISGSKYRSLRLQFQLPQSTYATMLFRELTKLPSTVNYQANLSKLLKFK